MIMFTPELLKDKRVRHHEGNEGTFVCVCDESTMLVLRDDGFLRRWTFEKAIIT